MRKELTPDERYEAGKVIGKVIIDLFELIAKIDNTSLQDAIDEWVSTYVAERIIQED